MRDAKLASSLDQLSQLPSQLPTTGLDQLSQPTTNHVATCTRQLDIRSFRARNRERARRHSLTSPHHQGRLQDAGKAISVPSQAVGAIHPGRLRLSDERSASQVLVSSHRGQDAGSRRSPTGLEQGEPLGQSALRAPAQDPQPDLALQGHDLHHHRTSVAYTRVVSSATGNVSGGIAPGQRGRVPLRAHGVSSAQNQSAHVADRCFQSLISSLQLEGYSESACRRIVSKWQDNGSNSTIKKYERIWRLHWVPFCQASGKDPTAYDVVTFTNFLDQVQQVSEQYASDHDKTAQHGTYKERCAAVSGCFELRYPDKPRLSMHPHVRAMSASNRRTAPNVPKYFELPDITGVLQQQIDEIDPFLAKTGSYLGFFSQMPIAEHRDKAMLLARLDIGNRSKDLSVINRVWCGPFAGLRGNQARCEITHVRYDFPKNWHSLIRMSPWIALGDYKFNSAGFQPKFHALCARSAIESYYRRTVSHSIAPTVDLDRPGERKTRLFISIHKADKGRRYIALKSPSIANRIKALLKAGGLDITKFQSHVLRHVSLNTQVSLGGNIDDVLARACVSKKVFALYYKLPLTGPATTAAEQVVFNDKNQENRDSQSGFELIQETNATTTSGSTTTTASSRSALRIMGAARKRRRSSSSALASRI